jgi:hypothetical protein
MARRKVGKRDLAALVSTLKAQYPYDDKQDLWSSLTWDWPGRPTPSILWEGGPDEWVFNEAVRLKAEALGLFVEAYSGYALCVYPGWSV